jgi:hypothetical protein
MYILMQFADKVDLSQNHKAEFDAVRYDPDSDSNLFRYDIYTDDEFKNVKSADIPVILVEDSSVDVFEIKKHDEYGKRALFFKFPTTQLDYLRIMYVLIKYMFLTRIGNIEPIEPLEDQYVIANQDKIHDKIAAIMEHIQDYNLFYSPKLKSISFINKGFGFWKTKKTFTKYIYSDDRNIEKFSIKINVISEKIDVDGERKTYYKVSIDKSILILKNLDTIREFYIPPEQYKRLSSNKRFFDKDYRFMSFMTVMSKEQSYDIDASRYEAVAKPDVKEPQSPVPEFRPYKNPLSSPAPAVPPRPAPAVPPRPAPAVPPRPAPAPESKSEPAPESKSEPAPESKSAPPLPPRPQSTSEMERPMMSPPASAPKPAPVPVLESKSDSAPPVSPEPKHRLRQASSPTMEMSEILDLSPVSSPSSSPHSEPIDPSEIKIEEQKGQPPVPPRSYQSRSADPSGIIIEELPKTEQKERTPVQPDQEIFGVLDRIGDSKPIINDVHDLIREIERLGYERITQ